MSMGSFIFSSCTTGNAKMPTADLKTDLDSLAYAIGISSSHGLKQNLAGSGVDSAYLKDFVQGLLDAASVKDSQKIAYNMGILYGQRYSDESFQQFNKNLFAGDSTKSLSKDQFMAGTIAGILEKDMKIDPAVASEYANKTVDKIKTAIAEKQFASNKAAGIAFLNENKQKEGIVTLPSGLQYKVITEGKGAKPTKSDRVKVNYRGTLIEGTEFDSSYKRNEPTIFGVDQVIPGWTEALQLMPVGSKWELYVPQELAYGSQDRGTIKPFSTLIFEMELLDIEKPAQQPAPASIPPVQPKK
jgi:FKBP-type peptidyl-prolyl cis-trans isomerase FklB